MSDFFRPGNNTFIVLLFVLLLSLGVFFRLYGLGDRNLWTDEAWVALAATQPTPSAVLQEGKSTPPLYLLTVWETVQLAGRSEATLRFTSCLLGVGTLLLFWPLSRTLLPSGGALVAFALASVSTRLVYFSKELKQYSADIFFAVLVFFLVEGQLRRQGQGGWLWFTLLLALGLGFSHPLVFILPVAAMVLWWELPQARKAIYFSFGALVLIFFGYYWFFFRGQVDPELLVYWQVDFPNLTSGKDFLGWLGAAWGRYVRYFFKDWGMPLGWVFLVTGLAYFFRSPNPRVIWYFFGPILATLIAALAQRYPFMGHAGGVRLMMFSAPMLYLVTGAGITTIFAWVWRRQHKLVGILFVATVIFWLQPVKLWQENLQVTANQGDIQPLVKYLEANRDSRDLIYVYYFAIYPFKYYYQGSPDGIMWGQSCQECCFPLPRERLKGVSKLWLIFTHFETMAEVEQYSRCLVGERWSEQIRLTQPGAALFCYTPDQGISAKDSQPVSPPTPF